MIKKEKKRRSKNIFKRFTIAYTVIAILGVLCWVGLYSLNNMIQSPKDVVDGTTSREEQSNEPKKEIITLLIGGTDESGYRTDTLMYVKFNTANNKLYMMSIPRDTYTTNKNAYLRINTIYSGGAKINELLNEVEDMLAVPDIDYYVITDIDLIPKIVDIIGGIKVTEGISNLWKKAQDKKIEFYFDLPEIGGKLTGAQVEKLVRYRGYIDGDISRGNMQRQIITDVMDQLLQPQSINKVSSLLTAVIENTKTNITLREAMKYISEISEVSLNEIVSESMPYLSLGYEVNGQYCVLANKTLARRIVEAWQ